MKASDKANSKKKKKVLLMIS